MGISLTPPSQAYEKISFHANGREFLGWESVRVTAGLAQDSIDFEISTTEIISAFESPFDVWHFPPGTVCEVFASGDLLVTGKVDSYLPRMSPVEHSVTITGRSNGREIADSSPDHPSGRFEQKTVHAIISELSKPFGVAITVAGVAAEAANAVVPLFQLRRGETVWSEAMRLIGDYGATLMGLPDGTVQISRAGAGRQSGGIAQGEMPGTVPIEEASAQLSGEGRFQQYRVIYQTALGTDGDLFEGEAIVEDSGVEEFRLSEHQAATEMNPARAAALAKWTASRAAGYSMQATLVVRGFRDTGGNLWKPGNIVFVHSSFLKLDADMVIVEAIFSQDNDRGTITTLTVMDPRSFFGEAGNSNSGPIWDFPIFEK